MFLTNLLEKLVILMHFTTFFCINLCNMVVFEAASVDSRINTDTVGCSKLAKIVALNVVHIGKMHFPNFQCVRISP